jgi:type IV secretion system protein VirB1
MHHVVRVESSFNPYAIGVVGGRLVRQPRNLPEALSTVRMLEQHGYNFSLGLAQVNRYNLAKYGLDSYEKAFQPCANVQAGSRILRECYSRSGGDWGKSFSCYYSGDFRTGYRHGYVQKVYASMRRGGDAIGAGAAPIAVIDRAQRRVSALHGQPGAERQPAAMASDGLIERRAAAAYAQALAAAAASTPAPSQYTATGLAAQPSQLQAPVAAMGAADAAAPAQFEAASLSAAQPPPANRPVLVTATRLGEAPAPQARPEQTGSGPDGAFVF